MCDSATTTILPFVGLGLLFLGCLALNRWMERDHKRRMMEMHERHERFVAEMRAICPDDEEVSDG